jgi:hypothetical protein
MDTATASRYTPSRRTAWLGVVMSTMMYEAPALAELGSVRELTQQAPPGKNGPLHDGSAFQSNFSCVVDTTPGSSCKGANPNS